MVFDLRRQRQGKARDLPLWPVSRAMTWRLVKRVMQAWK